MNKPYLSKRSAFSVVELLTVVSLISVLTVMVTPAVSSIMGATGTTRAVNDVSTVMEHARQSAMKLSTWVWVGVADVTAFNNGSPQICVVELASKDGSSDLSADNLMPLRRNLNVQGVRFSSEPDPNATVIGDSTPASTLDWPVVTTSGRRSVDFAKYVIGFSPKGEALLGGDVSPAWIKVPFVAHNNSSDLKSVLVSGPSGQVVVVH
ncbi:hypothetical protein TSACC_3397 [Terrimicrobium sacchariphilum]|uniref:Verru_Chthon cassette protein D n=1 Tax=Terrimicrobium sacchariphilum TaxID=690879 RepID=A0A146GDV2_TERSA|nr:hypothetical protein [Terrimicrobium sacchariphilum]GAT35332.1 hypothetical protein TSACC_3397 [Terrimicrobium sacchariphilum]